LLITHQVIENYWNGKATAEELQEVAKNVRKERWQTIQKAGVDIIPS
jgi:5-methyltetrahydropteroyltriglutamate--homocysteine methyltransferase